MLGPGFRVLKNQGTLVHLELPGRWQKSIHVTSPEMQNWEMGGAGKRDFRNVPKRAPSKLLVTHGENEAGSRERTWPRSYIQLLADP